MSRWFQVRQTTLEIDEPADALVVLPISDQEGDQEEEQEEGQKEDQDDSDPDHESPIKRILEPTAPDWDRETLSWDTSIETVHTLGGGLFERRYRWTFDEDTEQLVEMTAVSSMFSTLLLVGAVLVFLGAVAALVELPALPLQAAGATAILCGTVFAANTEVIVDTPYSSTTSTYLGALLPIGAMSVLAVGLPSLPRVGAAAFGCLAAGWYSMTADRARRLHGLAELGTGSIRSTPMLPRLHVVYTLLAIGSLWLFVGVVSRIQLHNATQVTASWIVVGVIVAILLGGIHGRTFSRSNVAVAVVLTIVAGVVTATQIRFAVWSPGVLARSLPLLGITSLVGSLLVAWWAAWLHLASLSHTAARRFSRTGRRVSTRTAGVFAYLIMCCSAALGASGLTWGWVGFQFVTASSGQIALIRFLLVFLFGTVAALPAIYFVAGSGYQLAAVARVVRTIRQETTPADEVSTIGERIDSLPFEPTHPIWVLDRDGYFAAAYTDPFDTAIVLSRGVFDQLSPGEIAAIVAHEESHFEHRGSSLQFYLAILSVFTLLGKNVIYGTYDFYEREFTADEAAISRLQPSDVDGRASLTNVLLAQSEGMDIAGDVPQFFPTMVTVPATVLPRTVVERSFYLLYGTFAGNVHPSPAERLEHLHTVDVDDLDDETL